MKLIALRVALILLFVTPSVFSAQIDTIAGTGSPVPNGTEGDAGTFNIGQPFGVEIGPDKALYICDAENHRVLRQDLATGKITTVAGIGKKGYGGDGGPATAASLNEPYEVRFGEAGTMYFVEMKNAIVRRVDAKGIISTVAGTGTPGFSGDGGPATKAQLSEPHSIALDREFLYIADLGNHRIRKVDLKTGLIDTIAGNGKPDPAKSGTKAAGQPLRGPRALWLDKGVLWIALREGNSVWRLEAGSGEITHVAGSGKAGFHDGTAHEATFNGPKGIVGGPQNEIFVMDTENHAVRRIDIATGSVSTIAGGGPDKKGFAGDGGDALQAKMDRPHGITAGIDGSIYVGDTNNHRIRKVSK